MPPIAILWVPTFELVRSSSSGLTFTCVYMCMGSCVVELHGGSWGELCGVGELCKGNFVGSYVGRWVALCEGAVWVGGWCCARELCGGMHTSHQMVWPYTIAPSTPSTRGIPHYPLTHPAPPAPPTAAAR